MASDGPGMRLQLWAKSEEKRLMGMVKQHSILLGETPVPGEIDCKYMQPPIYGTDLDLELQINNEKITQASNIPCRDLEHFRPDERTEEQSHKLGHRLCCKVAAFAVFDTILKGAAENAREVALALSLTKHHRSCSRETGSHSLGVPRLVAHRGEISFRLARSRTTSR